MKWSIQQQDSSNKICITISILLCFILTHVLESFTKHEHICWYFLVLVSHNHIVNSLFTDISLLTYRFWSATSFNTFCVKHKSIIKSNLLWIIVLFVCSRPTSPTPNRAAANRGSQRHAPPPPPGRSGNLASPGGRSGPPVPSRPAPSPSASPTPESAAQSSFALPPPLIPS